MPKQENLNGPEDNSEETPEQKEISEYLKNMATDSENTEKLDSREIKDAESFDELIEILGSKKELIGSGDVVYTSEKLIERVRKVMKSLETYVVNHKIAPNYAEELIKSFRNDDRITRTAGLRDKVGELCEIEINKWIIK